MVDHTVTLPDVNQIKDELRRIISEVTELDARDIADDLPLLDFITSSLALVAGMRLAYDRFGVLISIRKILEGQANLGGLAVFIARALSEQHAKGTRIDWKDVDNANDEVRVQHIPIAPSQRHVGFLVRYSENASAAYNEPIILRLQGRLDAQALQAAIEIAADRYEVMRMALSGASDTLELRTGVPIDLRVSYCSREHVDERLSELVARPFLVGDRLCRADLFRISDTDHILLIVGHALVVDHNGLLAIMDDIEKIYRMASGQKPTDMLRPLPSSIESACNWPSAVREEHTDFWIKSLGDSVPRLELPTDWPRQPIKTYKGGQIVVPIPETLAERVATWACSQDMEPASVWFASFTALIHRLTGQPDLLTGIESDRVSGKATEGVVARTRDVVPVRSSYHHGVSFMEWVRTMHGRIDKARQNCSLSFAELIELLQLPRDQSRSALVSVVFRKEDLGVAPAFGNINAAYAVPPAAGARHDIDFTWYNTPDGWQLACQYSTDLFTADTIARWVQGGFAFIEAGINHPNEACGHLPIVTDTDRRMQLYGWNDTARSYPRECTVLDLILEQVRTRGMEPAVRSDNAAVSYAQLGARIDKIACMLQNAGVNPGDRVAVLLERSTDLVAVLLAIWRVGATYVPLDLKFPKQRLEYMMSDAEARIMVTSRSAIARLEDMTTPFVVFLDADHEMEGPQLLHAHSARPADSAYIMYTSGSTGKPKGVEITHSALTNLILASRDLLEFSTTDSLLAITTISFDISCLELFVPLVGGGALHIAEDGIASDGIQLAEKIETLKPSFVQATPSTWKMLIAAGWGGSEALTIVSTGEALGREFAEKLLVRGRTVLNLYGPTETTVYSSSFRVCSAPGEPMRIGRPYANTQMYILDAQLQPIPVGVSGDLYIGGEGLSRGYWRRPELTEERFIANPFRPGERMYRTGDLARFMPNGDIVCQGRLDDQVKVHGVRIEFGEIEMAMRAIPGVSDAVVTSWIDADGNAQLVGHVVALEGPGITAKDVRTELRKALPEVMVPPFILFVETFPLTANGKILRAALPVPSANANASGDVKTGPATPTERLMADVWSRVLAMAPAAIGRDESFLDLGGHSLLMTQLMIEIRRIFHVSFSMREFFEVPTIRGISALVDDLRRKRTAGQQTVPARDEEWGRQRMEFLRREAELPQNMAPPRGAVFEAPREYENALLTGATGFLGVYIVAEILRGTRANLYCLVRPRQGADAKARIKEQMETYAVWRDDDAWRSDWEKRVHIVEGDVILPRLGLSGPLYESLARDVDCVIHSAAHVNFIYPYEALRATNVLGVHEIIRFAFHGRIKPVHYMSTAAIWPMGSEYTFHEKDPIDHGKLLNLGYDEAKWVGERCLINASDRGLPVTRYRPGEVGGDSESGRLVLSHFIVAAFKGFLQYGAFPSVDTYLDVTPVDYVAKSVVHMAFHRNAHGKAFHLTNPNRCHLSEALMYLRSLGYEFEELPFEELRDRLIQDEGFSGNALFPYQAALEDMDWRSMQVPHYDCGQTLGELAGSGISCAPVDEKLLGTYLGYLTEIGYLPRPEELRDHATRFILAGNGKYRSR